MSDIEDYLDTVAGLSSGALTEIDLGKPGDVQAFKDAAAAQKGCGYDLRGGKLFRCDSDFCPDCGPQD